MESEMMMSSTEKNDENKIDLSHVEMSFCTDEIVYNYYEERIDLLKDKERWIEENREDLEKNKAEIDVAVSMGLIGDNKLETVWQYHVDNISNLENGVEEVRQIRDHCEENIDNIKLAVSKRLGEYLPQWQATKSEVIFTMNADADFRVDDGVVIVDLGRLRKSDNPIETVTQGVTHEIFHVWMEEGNKHLDVTQDQLTDKELVDSIVFHTIDEGLAVLIGGQSLQEYHEKKGRDYAKYTRESFEVFGYFLQESNREKLERIRMEEFKDMGHFYVVGNVIVSTVMQNMEPAQFRKLIEAARESPKIFFQEYQEIESKKS